MAHNAFHLDASDAAELAEMLGFLQDFVQRADPGVTAAFTEFVGVPGFTLDELCCHLERFQILLGGIPGDELPQADY
ncbi:hypothetical protein ABIA39_007910 [Nocardia sp. GAS34]|uniref:hypothetical protein n=1 Tax=unclassified Nocardia TaxID=2637762 RepID=UPI003D1EE615